MKAIRLLLVGLLIAGTSIFIGSAKAADTSVTLSCVTFSWPDTIYRPLPGGNVTFNMSYQSTCPYDVLLVKYTLTDKFGTAQESNSIVGLKKGVLANQSQTWYGFGSSTAVEPFSLVFVFENFASYGLINPSPKSVTFNFTERTPISPTPTPTVTITATPAPAPTVTVTSTPAPAPTVYVSNPADETLKDLVTSLKAQISLLNTKVKKICAVKPKPKGC